MRNGTRQNTKLKQINIGKKKERKRRKRPKRGRDLDTHRGREIEIGR